MTKSTVDQFRVRKIYPDTRDPKRAKPWLLGKGDWKSRKSIFSFEGESRFENGDLILRIENHGHVFPPWGSHPGRGRHQAWSIHGYVVSEKNQQKLRKRGYMGTPSDWKNVEVTLYAKVNDVVPDILIEEKYRYLKQFALIARGGGKHSEGDPCEGTGLYAVLNIAGNVAIVKELFHGPGGYAEEWPHHRKNGVTDPLYDFDTSDGKWIGMKGIFYNKSNGNPKIELWLAKNGDNDWGSEAVLEVEDDGNWFLRPNVGNTECKGSVNEQITWGGPSVVFRWDALSNVDIKWTSVREIVPREDWSLKELLETNEISLPVNIGELGKTTGLLTPVSVRELIERLI